MRVDKLCEKCGEVIGTDDIHRHWYPQEVTTYFCSACGHCWIQDRVTISREQLTDWADRAIALKSLADSQMSHDNAEWLRKNIQQALSPEAEEK